ncbi:MAG: 16S rRNA (cytosine(967)-C(5))-methyltransferase, partial [Gammaproteobacteria bacterium]|nr:16S rRNA (cytosine(967)-C(5))-methyltransferase [Gammaproteobacteria bacterium]
APGGKTCAMLERVSGQLDMLALDNNEERLQRVSENLDRLKLKAKITCANAVDTESWWDGQPFDAILLDAPCSATGVIRRHPDIKLLRHAKDISRLNLLQQELLVALWPCLKKGGKLLYSTCSVLRAENEQQVSTFIEVTKDAKAIPTSHPLASNCSIGMQFLPGNDNLDGFYYALLEKY